jgi:hypothetical protein
VIFNALFFELKNTQVRKILPRPNPITARLDGTMLRKVTFDRKGKNPTTT